MAIVAPHIISSLCGTGVWETIAIWILGIICVITMIGRPTNFDSLT